MSTVETSRGITAEDEFGNPIAPLSQKQGENTVDSERSERVSGVAGRSFEQQELDRLEGIPEAKWFPSLSRIPRILIVMCVVAAFATAAFFVGEQALQISRMASKHTFGLVVASGALWGTTVGLIGSTFNSIFSAYMSNMFKRDLSDDMSRLALVDFVYGGIGFSLAGTAVAAGAGTVLSLLIQIPVVGAIHW